MHPNDTPLSQVCDWLLLTPDKLLWQPGLAHPDEGYDDDGDDDGDGDDDDDDDDDNLQASFNLP